MPGGVVLGALVNLPAGPFVPVASGVAGPHDPLGPVRRSILAAAVPVVLVVGISFIVPAFQSGAEHSAVVRRCSGGLALGVELGEVGSRSPPGRGGRGERSRWPPGLGAERPQPHLNVATGPPGAAAAAQDVPVRAGCPASNSSHYRG